MELVSRLLYLVAAAGNLLPAVGAISAARLQALYGMVIADPSLVVLMRHRAVLLGIVGALLAAAAFRRSLRPVAFVAGLVSMVSFLALAADGDVNPAVRRVGVIDLGLIAALVGAGAIDARARRAA